MDTNKVRTWYTYAIQIVYLKQDSSAYGEPLLQALKCSRQEAGFSSGRNKNIPVFQDVNL